MPKMFDFRNNRGKYGLLPYRNGRERLVQIKYTKYTFILFFTASIFYLPNTGLTKIWGINANFTLLLLSSSSPSLSHRQHGMPPLPSWPFPPAPSCHAFSQPPP